MNGFALLKGVVPHLLCLFLSHFLHQWGLKHKKNEFWLHGEAGGHFLTPCIVLHTYLLLNTPQRAEALAGAEGGSLRRDEKVTETNIVWHPSEAEQVGRRGVAGVEV